MFPKQLLYDKYKVVFAPGKIRQVIYNKYMVYNYLNQLQTLISLNISTKKGYFWKIIKIKELRTIWCIHKLSNKRKVVCTCIKLGCSELKMVPKLKKIESYAVKLQS